MPLQPSTEEKCKLMETFKDLYIDTSETSMADFIEKLTCQIHPPWERSYENEENLRYIGEVAFCFKCNEDENLPSASLSILQEYENRWYIPNVFPLTPGQLSYQQHNEILTDFYENQLVPASKELSIKIEITSGSLTDADIVGSAKAATLLNSFSSRANKSTRGTHSSDRRRWLSFIEEAYNSDFRIDTDNLKRLLFQQGWSEEHAMDLVIELDFGLELLEFMEK